VILILQLNRLLEIRNCAMMTPVKSLQGTKSDMFNYLNRITLLQRDRLGNRGGCKPLEKVAQDSVPLFLFRVQPFSADEARTLSTTSRLEVNQTSARLKKLDYRKTRSTIAFAMRPGREDGRDDDDKPSLNPLYRPT